MIGSVFSLRINVFYGIIVSTFKNSTATAVRIHCDEKEIIL
jgi:hypothetical protein